jgi:hypothetical protein
MIIDQQDMELGTQWEMCYTDGYFSEHVHSEGYEQVP